MHLKKSKKIIAFLAIIFSALVPIYAYAAQLQRPVYSSNCKETKKIALTFDDGPHPRITQEILSILDRYNVKATFFIIGINAKNYPEALSRVIDAGHEIGNHTYSHKILKDKTKDVIYKEIFDTEKEISQKSSKALQLIRPPCGLYDDNLVSIAKENGYKIVLWNIDTHDWAHSSSQSMVSNVLTRVSGGDIILFHDYISGENNTPETLKILIPKLLNMGYEFVTVSQLLQTVE